MITFIVIYILCIGYMLGAMARMMKDNQQFNAVEQLTIMTFAPVFVAISIGYLVEHLARK